VTPVVTEELSKRNFEKSLLWKALVENNDAENKIVKLTSS